jgi:hypothetical protein
MLPSGAVFSEMIFIKLVYENKKDARGDERNPL